MSDPLPSPASGPPPPDTIGSRSAPPSPRPKAQLCPYCGHLSGNTSGCDRCGGLFEPLSRQASQEAMGAWFVRDTAMPFLPGCSFSTLQGLVKRGRIGPESVLRGPTTNQFWCKARDVPGVANLLGLCHACRAALPHGEHPASCPACATTFLVPSDRQFMGLEGEPLAPNPRAVPGTPPTTAVTVASSSEPTPVRSHGRTAPAAAVAAGSLRARETAPSQTDSAVLAMRERRIRRGRRRIVALAATGLTLLLAIVTAIVVLANQRRQHGNPAPQNVERPATTVPTPNPRQTSFEPAAAGPLSPQPANSREPDLVALKVAAEAAGASQSSVGLGFVRALELYQRLASRF